MSWLGCRQSSSQLSLSRSVSSAAYGEVMAGCERLGVVMYGRQRGGGRLSSSQWSIRWSSSVVVSRVDRVRHSGRQR